MSENFCLFHWKIQVDFICKFIDLKLSELDLLNNDVLQKFYKEVANYCKVLANFFKACKLEITSHLESL